MPLAMKTAVATRELMDCFDMVRRSWLTGHRMGVKYKARCFRCCDFAVRLNIAACGMSPDISSAGRKLLESRSQHFGTSSMFVNEKHAFDRSVQR